MKKLLVFAAAAVLTAGSAGGIHAQARTRISMSRAQSIALATVPGGSVESGKLKQKDGLWVYEFDIKQGDKRGHQEVRVDANTGHIVGAKTEENVAEKADHGARHVIAETKKGVKKVTGKDKDKDEKEKH
jgi:hypothetical protein